MVDSAARGTNEDGLPHPVDTIVGNNIRARRKQIGMSHEAFAKALGLTVQQVDKYERGVNRVSASKLFEVAGVLDMAISGFYQGATSGESSQNVMDLREGFVRAMSISSGAPLIASFLRIVRPQHRKLVADVAAALAADDACPEDAPTS